MPWSAPPGDPAEKSDDYAIRVRGIHKTFGTHHVLRGVDLDVLRGRINIVIGGSGQGKSVLMKHMMGLLKPDAGQIHVDGQDLVPLGDYALNQLRKKFGMLFQYAALFDSLSVEENIEFPLVEHRRDMKRAERREIVRATLKSLQLAEVLLRKFPSELSGGQRKRVGLARALVLKPEILLYDEPTTGLDPIATKNVDDMIRDISQERGVTSVVISHDMASTFRIADRISMLYEGRIVESGTPEEIAHSKSEYLRTFIETSGAVSLAGVAEDHRAARAEEAATAADSAAAGRTATAPMPTTAPTTPPARGAR